MSADSAFGLISYVTGMVAGAGMRLPYRSLRAGRASNAAAWKGRRRKPSKRKKLRYSKAR